MPSGLDDIHITSDPTGSVSLPQDQTSELSVNSDDADEVASHIDFDKLLQPSSSEYYYSDANLSNRALLQRVRSKKSSSRGLRNGLSPQSRASLLRKRSQTSAYCGPAPLRKKDGSSLKSARKTAARRPQSPGGASTDSSAPSEARRCAFSCVDIREYERVAGDNPCVTKGVPLSLGWGYYQHESIELGEYEVNRGPARDKIEMMVPSDIRKLILRDEFGVSISDINAAMKEVIITKRQRKSTLGSEPLEGLTEAAQSTKRKLRRFVKGTSTAKEEEKVWALARQNALGKRSKAEDNACGRV